DVVGDPHRMLADVEVGRLAPCGRRHVDAPLRIDGAGDRVGDVQVARPLVQNHLGRRTRSVIGREGDGGAGAEKKGNPEAAEECHRETQVRPQQHARARVEWVAWGARQVPAGAQVSWKRNDDRRRVQFRRCVPLPDGQPRAGRSERNRLASPRVRSTRGCLLHQPNSRDARGTGFRIPSGCVRKIGSPAEQRASSSSVSSASRWVLMMLPGTPAASRMMPAAVVFARLQPVLLARISDENRNRRGGVSHRGCRGASWAEIQAGAHVLTGRCHWLHGERIAHSRDCRLLSGMTGTLCTVTGLFSNRMQHLSAAAVLAWAGTSAAFAAVPSVSEAAFGELPDGRVAHLYTFGSEDSGIQISVTNLGASIVNLVVPDREGRRADVALGFERADQYAAQRAFLGATEGRYANRIAGGAFVWDGERFELPTNNTPGGRPCTLHGGSAGFHKELWRARAGEVDGRPVVEMTFVSPDGAGGFPGELSVTLTFSLAADNELRVDYKAVTTRPTPVNLRHQLDCSVRGEGAGAVLGQRVGTQGDRITQADRSLILTGQFMPVQGAPVHFLEPRRIGARIAEQKEQFE